MASWARVVAGQVGQLGVEVLKTQVDAPRLCHVLAKNSARGFQRFGICQGRAAEYRAWDVVMGLSIHLLRMYQPSNQGPPQRDQMQAPRWV
jgi:hypothetical protein